jgi:hypothetical protein
VVVAKQCKTGNIVPSVLVAKNYPMSKFEGSEVADEVAPTKSNKRYGDAPII